jgi:prevent-host-death family protein
MADRRQANDKIEIIIMLMTMKNPQARGQARECEISTDELRLKFDRVLKAVKQGRTLTLTYRNKPLARIVPLKEDRALSEDDPIYRMYEFAEPIGAPLMSDEMDKLIYGSSGIHRYQRLLCSMGSERARP